MKKQPASSFRTLHITAHDVTCRNSAYLIFTAVSNSNFQRQKCCLELLATEYLILNPRSQEFRHSDLWGAFANIGKIEYYFRHVCLSHRMEKDRLTLDEFSWNLRTSRKPVKKIQVSSKSGKNKVYFTWSLWTFMITRRWIPFRMRNISGKIL